VKRGGSSGLGRLLLPDWLTGEGEAAPSSEEEEDEPEDLE
jgi:hypothetical protein